MLDLLNVIFVINDITFTEEQVAFFAKNYSFVRDLSESRKVNDRVLCQGNVINIAQLEAIKQQLIDLGASPSIIGVWYIENGLQYGYKYDNENNIVLDDSVEIIYPFNLTEYTNYLDDIREFDSEGHLIGSSRPTEQEAQYIQVNKFYGMPDRQL